MGILSDLEQMQFDLGLAGIDEHESVLNSSINEISRLRHENDSLNIQLLKVYSNLRKSKVEQAMDAIQQVVELIESNQGVAMRKALKCNFSIELLSVEEKSLCNSIKQLAELL